MTGGRAFAFVLAVLVSACAGGPEAPQFQPYSFAGDPTINLEVARITIENRVSPLKPPYVEHRFPISPAEAAQIWARDRLRAAGDSGVARFIILEASVVEEELPTDSGIRGILTREQAQRYDATLTVRLEVEAADGTGFVEATAHRRRTVGEKITLNERDRAFYEMTGELIEDLGQQLERAIRSSLARYVTF